MFIFIILLLNSGFYSQNNLNYLTLTEVKSREFPAYNQIEKLNNRDLLLFLKENKTDDTISKILSVIQTRNFTKNELKIKIPLLKRIELTKNLNKNSINLIKYNPYYFIPLSYLEAPVFTNKDRKYLFKLLTEAVKQRNSLVVQRIFSLDNLTKTGFFNAIILIKTIKEKEKIFFTSSLLDIELNIIEKKKFRKECLKKLYNFKNHVLLNNILFLLPEFFTFSENDLISIYNSINKDAKLSFLNSLINQDIKLPVELINLIDLNNNKLFLTLLKYSDKNNHKIKKIEILLAKKIKSNKELLLYSNIYLNKNYLKILIKNNNILIQFLRNLVENNKKNKLITEFASENWNNLKINLYTRIILTKYLLNNHNLNNIQILKFIISLFKNKKLEYKSDEYYISVILPLIAENYNKSDYKYYVELLDMLNKTAIESTLKAIEISNDKRFIKPLKSLLKENEIRYIIEKTLWKLNN